MPEYRAFLIDALNVAYWSGEPPSLRLPLALLGGLLERGCTAQLVFDASARHRLAAESALYLELLGHARYMVEVPSGHRADGVILKRAQAAGAGVISRDRFRDYLSRHRKLINDPARLMGGVVSEGEISLPAIDLAVPVPESAQHAWETTGARLDSGQ